ncbi:zinc-dependent metalloprotease [Dyella sp. LX-66]|uniref:reprolysin-like metallopeptidase n=1 Tax=unclassified Dyella TaxID=2634549 RepID=UPI001BDF8417|nr:MULTISPECIES: zinc-dependent metalloprotease family protein [unclassified Dyella]MBT2115665.1 zinc-dependent metalloprotease [Dyella sp. LX-1]MBT2139480.1 zinc-dependent metalloprotease [Dyella sp. LX-66]
MKTSRLLACALSALFFSITGRAAITATIDLRPAAIPDGQMPSGYDGIIFNIAKGDEPYRFRLPQKPKDGAWVLAASSAASAHAVLNEKIDFPRNRVSLHHCGAFCIFRYAEKSGRWSVESPQIRYYSSVRNTVPEGSWNYAFYDIRPGDWHQRINLPATANDGSLIFIRSSSARESGIHPDSLLYASTSVIRSGDEYRLRYLSDVKKWAIEESPERPIDLRVTGAYPSAPRSLFVLTDQQWIPRIRLPTRAGDRDRITVRSSTSRAALIDGAGIEAKGSFGLTQGQEYTFMYVAEKKQWIVQDAPDTVYTAASLKNGAMPSPATPRSIYVSDQARYVPNIELPKAAPKGARIMFKGQAVNPFNVIAPSGDGNGKAYPVRIGETPAFVSDGRTWARETVIIDVLGVYSSEAASFYGDDLMRARLLEGIMNTNHALENSGVNFRTRLVGTRKINAPAQWTDIETAALSLGDHPQIRKWRDNTQADLVYYEGAKNQPGICGAAFSSQVSELSFAAATSISCRTKTMAHEIGHLLGLLDGKRPWDYGNVGYPIAGTVMASGRTAFYSTPERYTQDYGRPMGIKDQYDAVNALNLNSSFVSKFR